MNSPIEAALQQLLATTSLDRVAAEAQLAWIRLQFGLGASWEPTEDVVTLAHQVALLTPDIPIRLDELPAEIRTRLEALGGCLDIAARISRDRRREFSKLAAAIYLTAQQPTRALRIIRRLASAEGVDATLVPYHRILETSYRLTGMRAVAAVTEGISRATFGEPGHSLEDGLVATTYEPAIFRVVREAEVALRYRRAHDLQSATGHLVPEAYIDRAYNGPNWSRRHELLPPQLSVLRGGYMEALRSFVTTPTGTGKTFLAELRIAAALRDNPSGLVVYIAPLNALARQVHRDLQRRVSSIGQVTLWTGAYEIDESVTDLGNVLVTTPEKLDSILRLDLADDPRSADLLQRLCLVIADEAHQVADGSRGVLYEFLLLRLKKRLPNLALVALSAVQPDPAPYARFLRSTRGDAAVQQIEWSATTVWDLLWAKAGDLRARKELGPAPRLARPKQTKAAAALAAATLLPQLESILLVEARRDWAESLAAEIYGQYREYLDQRLTENLRDDRSAADLEALAAEVGERLYEHHPLVGYVRSGLAVHHAGIPPSIRRRIEELARRELIHTVVATTTLAEGIDLPFRAVILCRLALPFGQPFRASRIRNIRGRAARPGYSADGVFVVLEPENLDTRAYQYFIDHYWDESVESTESPSALNDLFSTEPIRVGPVSRGLESQLLAYFSENEVELQDAGGVMTETLYAEALGPTSQSVSRLAASVQRSTESMLEAPPLLKVASPISPTGFGRAAILGGLSASSAVLIRDVLLENASDIDSIASDLGEVELALRLAWLPWEAVETTDEYRNALSRRRPFQRTPSRLHSLVDGRLADQYELTRLLLSRRTLADLAATEKDAIRGKTTDERLARLVEWGGRVAGVLPWTLTGVIRIADVLAQDNPELSAVSLVGPYTQYISAWIPAPGASELVRRGVLDRDAAISVLEAGDLWEANVAEIISWAQQHELTTLELIGERQWGALRRNAPDNFDDEDLDDE